MDTGKSDWIHQLPMVKASVKAMDSVKHFLLNRDQIEIEQFVVMGGSKRGWTTWLVAAAKPDYVAAIIPAVIPVLNTSSTLDRIYQTYCFWPPALKDCLIF
jgi:PhoPQ-activated pathogenicity-related protein